MDGECCPPYPHHSWLAHWISISPPQVFDVHECRRVTHRLLLTTGGEADVRWRCGDAETAYRAAAGGLGFFPCDHLTHSMAFTSAAGFTAYDVIVPEQHLRAVCAAEGLEPAPPLRASPDFRDPLLEASLLRLSTRAAGHQLSEDIGDEIAARQVVLRLCAIIGGRAPDWQRDGSFFTPEVMRQLVVASDETVVLTLHEALTPAEKILASTEAGASKVEQYHRALFAVSCDELRREIQRLTGRKVREAAVVVEPATGAIVHAFTSGTVVQIFQLEPHGVTTHVSAGIAAERANPSG